MPQISMHGIHNPVNPLTCLLVHKEALSATYVQCISVCHTDASACCVAFLFNSVEYCLLRFSSLPVTCQTEQL